MMDSVLHRHVSNYQLLFITTKEIPRKMHKEMLFLSLLKDGDLSLKHAGGFMFIDDL
jgi:hypothetical protein